MHASDQAGTPEFNATALAPGSCKCFSHASVSPRASSNVMCFRFRAQGTAVWARCRSQSGWGLRGGTRYRVRLRVRSVMALEQKNGPEGNHVASSTPLPGRMNSFATAYGGPRKPSLPPRPANLRLDKGPVRTARHLAHGVSVRPGLPSDLPPDDGRGGSRGQHVDLRHRARRIDNSGMFKARMVNSRFMAPNVDMQSYLVPRCAGPPPAWQDTGGNHTCIDLEVLTAKADGICREIATTLDLLRFTPGFLGGASPPPSPYILMKASP